MTIEVAPVSESWARVNYSETDQMGVVYHANYLVWMDIARGEHLRRTGITYAELEARGLRLAVSDLRIRYRRAARYDDRVRVRCWVREAGSRRIVFGYAMDVPPDDRLVATAETSMVVLGEDLSWSRLPPDVATALPVTPDPVRLF